MKGFRESAVWILTDGKIGDVVQCRGMAGALGVKPIEKIISPGSLFAWSAPWGPIDPSDGPGREGSPIAPPFPDILIASGRRAVPYARKVKKESGGKTFVALLKDPRVTADFADLIWAPAHDRRSGENVYATLTSPHGVSAAIEAARLAPHPAIAGLPKPMLGVVLGGPSGGASYDAAAASAIAAHLRRAMKGFASLAITPSRRTPAAFMDALSLALDGSGAFIWDGDSDNPYASLLAHSASIIAAGDSHNMMSEAAATEVGVYVYRPPGLSGKLTRFLDRLIAKGRARDFDGSASPFEAEPLDATQEIAREVMKRLNGDTQ